MPCFRFAHADAPTPYSHPTPTAGPRRTFRGLGRRKFRQRSRHVLPLRHGHSPFNSCITPAIFCQRQPWIPTSLHSTSSSARVHAERALGFTCASCSLLSVFVFALIFCSMSLYAGGASCAACHPCQMAHGCGYGGGSKIWPLVPGARASAWRVLDSTVSMPQCICAFRSTPACGCASACKGACVLVYVCMSTVNGRCHTCAFVSSGVHLTLFTSHHHYPTPSALSRAISPDRDMFADLLGDDFQDLCSCAGQLEKV